MKTSIFTVLFVSFFSIFSAQIPPNYYNGTVGLTGSALKTQLKTIISNGHLDLGYSGLWTAYQTTDRDFFYENDGSILDIYSENPTNTDPYNFSVGTNQCGSNGYANEGDCYNREHIVPQSLFYEDFPMKSDVHFIRPTDGKVNGNRSNYPFGNVGTSTITSLNGSKLGSSISPGYSGIVFEPIDAFKGDVARMVFYFVTRYEDQLSSFLSGNMLGGSAFPGLETWELNTLLAWHYADPVSTIEIDRNNASYNYQGNRNPFIDDPSFVNKIWGTPTLDTQVPSAPTNLSLQGNGSTTLSISWTASTDNIGVASYTIYLNGVVYGNVTGTATTLINLMPNTTYSIYIVANDAAGNASPQSNTITPTTLSGTSPSGNCGNEDFESIPAANSSYSSRTWSNNSITWTATNARTDETINNSRAITFRNGTVSSTVFSGGIQNLTLTTQLKYSGTNGNLEIEVNGITVGTIPYSDVPTTTILQNLNIAANASIIIKNNTSNRVAIDNLLWTCTSLATVETKKQVTQWYPNPVKNGMLYTNDLKLKNNAQIKIYSLDGKLVKSIKNPFIKGNFINLKNLPKGNYLIATDHDVQKIIIE